MKPRKDATSCCQAVSTTSDISSRNEQFSEPGAFMLSNGEENGVASWEQAAGFKRNAGTCLPPLPPPLASKRLACQQNENPCVSSLTLCSGCVAVGGRPSTMTVDAPTPTSRPELPKHTESCQEVITADCHVFPLESSMTEALTETSLLTHHDHGAHSTSDATNHSIAWQHEASTAVNCCEELDDLEEEDLDDLEACTQSPTEASCKLLEDAPNVDLQHLNTPASAPRALASSDCTPSEAAQPSPPLPTQLEQCGFYEEDIFTNLRQAELSRKPSWGYLESNQKDLLVEHRRIMVNWLVEFAEEFSLEPDTLFLCVSILDQFLLRGPAVKKGSLQLLGTACMLISVKYNECNPPNMAQSCCIASEGSFSQPQVVAMEALVLKTIGYSCALPTALTFLWHYLKGVGPDLQLEKLSEYLATLAITDYGLLKFYPSAISAASVLLGGVLLGRAPQKHLDEMRSEYSIQDLRPIVKVILGLHRQAGVNNQFSSIHRKFSQHHHLSVATLSFPLRKSFAGTQST